MKKALRSIALILAAALFLTACGGGEAPESGEVSETAGEYTVTLVDATHYAATADNARVFYEIFVGSFSDSNGDGIGDLRGIINRFDYLNDGDDENGTSLGVEGIWLTPIFSSPSYHKYDVTDYYTIDPDFGTEQDLKDLIALCHERNVKLIIDLPINHTGYMNKWFLEFISAHRSEDTENKYYSYYSYYHGGEDAPAGRSFSQLSGTNDFFECNFSGSMPELDFDNEDVRAEVLEIARHYLEMGVDGFRFDAAKYVYYGDNAACAEFWNWYIGELRKIDPDVYTVAEVWDGDGITDIYFPYVNCFDFFTSQEVGLIAVTANAGDVNVFTSYVAKYLARVGAMRDGATYIPFISNHDTDRAAGYLTAASGTMKTAANLYLLSPGSPFIYYGEEIGMRGSRGGASTDANRRLAMLWGDGDTVADPVGSTYPKTSQTDATVQSQISDENGLYNHYKKLIMIRKANPEIARGDYSPLKLSGTKAGGFVSTLNGSSVCVIHNTANREVTVDLSSTAAADFKTVTDFIGEYASIEGAVLTLGPRTSAILR